MKKIVYFLSLFLIPIGSARATNLLQELICNDTAKLEQFHDTITMTCLMPEQKPEVIKKLQQLKSDLSKDTRLTAATRKVLSYASFMVMGYNLLKSTLFYPVVVTTMEGNITCTSTYYYQPTPIDALVSILGPTVLNAAIQTWIEKKDQVVAQNNKEKIELIDKILEQLINQ